MIETEDGQPCPHGRWTGVCVPCMDAEYKKWIMRVTIAYGVATTLVVLAAIVLKAIFSGAAVSIATVAALVIVAGGVYVLRLTAPARRWTR